MEIKVNIFLALFVSMLSGIGAVVLLMGLGLLPNFMLG